MLTPSLVHLTFDMPFAISGITDRNYHGTGLLVDAERGLVVTDRNTVPVSLGDVRLTFGGALEVPGKVVFVHPLHNLAVISYDPKLIGSTPMRAARLDTKALRLGQQVTVVGMDGDGALKSRSTQVASIDPLQLPLSRTMQFRDSNLEVAQLVNPPVDFDGVLVSKEGAVQALWSSFAFEGGRETVQGSRAVAIDLVVEMLDHVRAIAPLYTLDVELNLQPLTSARKLGLSDEWLRKLEQRDPQGRQVLSVARMTGGSAATKLLQQGDLVLAVDGVAVTRFRDVERAVVDRQTAAVTVWRGKGEQTIQVPTTALSGNDVERIVQWAGATLQAPHRAMSAQRGIVPEGVYVAFFAYGSPATRYRLFPGRRIVEVDGQATPDLDAFLKVVAGRPDRSSLRLRTLTWNNAPEVITLKLDRHYWPTWEVTRSANGWDRRSLE
jgi:S1-C subfamily serine protease